MREGGCKNKSEVKVKGSRYYPRKQTPKDPMQRHTDCCASLSKKTASRVLADGWIQTQSKRRNQIPKRRKKQNHIMNQIKKHYLFSWIWKLNTIKRQISKHEKWRFSWQKPKTNLKMAKSATLKIPTPHDLSFITHNISLAAPHNGLNREAPPKRGYGREGISLVEEVGNLSFEKVQQSYLTERFILWLWKSQENIIVVLRFFHSLNKVHL